MSSEADVIIFRPGWHVAVALRAAAARLLEMDRLRGGDGEILRDVELALGDDGESAILFCNWNDDRKTLHTTFKLPAPVAEDDFDPDAYLDLIEHPHGLYD
jgi:hypothetical protein